MKKEGRKRETEGDCRRLKADFVEGGRGKREGWKRKEEKEEEWGMKKLTG